MRAGSRSTVCALAVALAAACGGKARPAPAQPTPPPATEAPAGQPVSDAELEQTMQAGLAFIEELAGALVDVTGKDCATIAKAIDDTVARHGDVIEASARLDRDPAAKVKADAWLQAHQPELDAAATKIGQAVGPCQDDPAVQAAAAKLGAE